MLLEGISDDVWVKDLRIFSHRRELGLVNSSSFVQIHLSVVLSVDQRRRACEKLPTTYSPVIWPTTYETSIIRFGYFANQKQCFTDLYQSGHRKCQCQRLSSN